MLIASVGTYLYLLLLIIFGLLFHVWQKFAKHYNWMDYVEAPKRERRVKAGTAVGNVPEEPL